MLLPEFFPRFKELFASGFLHLSYLLAIIYQTLNLLPRNHPYLNPDNIGRYGLRHVIAAAADNLVLDKKNIDQILVFLCTLMGLALLALQFIILITAFIFHNEVFAQTNFVNSLPSIHDLLSVNSIYGHGSAITQADNGAQDITFIILDKVFGVSGIYNSCISLPGVDCLNLENNPIPTPSAFPSAFHIAMHNLMAYYTYGIFFVSVMIILYFITTIVGETVTTGTPFGQRVNKLWAPIRLIVFFALLIPIHQAAPQSSPTLNGAQLITLWTAKFASNFATNAWGYYADTHEAATGGTALMSNEEMIARPKSPDISNLVAFIFLAKTCQIVEERDTDDRVKAYAVSSSSQIDPDNPVDLQTSQDIIYTDDIGLMQRAQGGTLTISIGHYDKEKYKEEIGYVKPVCGRITLDVSGPYKSLDYGSLLDYTADNPLYQIDKINLGLIQRLWADPEIQDYADCFVNHNYSKGHNTSCALENANTFMTDQLNYWSTNFYGNNIKAALDNIIENYDSSDPTETRNKGWAGAALWYNYIAKVNGDVIAHIWRKPQASLYPSVMERVAKAHASYNENTPNTSVYNPEMPDAQKVEYDIGERDAEKAQTLYKAHKMWNADSFDTEAGSEVQGNLFVDAVNWIYGTSGIFSMRENADVHPLAQLTALGKSMLEATVRNIALGEAGGVAALFGGGTSIELLKTLGEALRNIGLGMITMSVILYYLLPFMPFIYFFFAVSGWIKSIFEAMVAMPLWALAHVRIDGDGLPGKAASNGYYLLLEIFLRPILILFGLLTSLIFFSAMVSGLNDIFDIVVSNVGGSDRQAGIEGTFGEVQEFMRGPIDEFFFTAMYVVICYMMGLSCFKLVDLIPNKILRWAGVSVATMQEGAGDPASKITKSFFTGGTLMTSRVSGGLFATLTG